MKRLLFSVLTIVSDATVAAAPGGRMIAAPIHYVATNGRDGSGCGSAESPCATLAFAVARAAPGDVWIVEDGVYGPAAPCADPDGSMALTIDKAGTSAALITIKAKNKWRAVLDGQMRCHSVINFGPNAAWWVIQDFDIKRGTWGGIWSNSKGGKHIAIRGNHIHDIGNRNNSTVIGEAGIYTDAAAEMIVDGNVIDNVGRVDDAGAIQHNSYDHGIYSHGALTIVNNLFYRARWGWHIQTAAGFSGLIAHNTFLGPDMYPHETRDGSIMLWGAAGGAITVRNNIFLRSNDAPIHTSGFKPRGCYFDHNLTDALRIFDEGAPCAVENNLVTTDPMLTNASLDCPDPRLLPGSPAVGGGVAVPEAALDINGVPRPQGGGSDLGASEHVRRRARNEPQTLEARPTSAGQPERGGVCPGGLLQNR